MKQESASCEGRLTAENSALMQKNLELAQRLEEDELKIAELESEGQEKLGQSDQIVQELQSKQRESDRTNA